MQVSGHIVAVKIATQSPRANGQAEEIVATVNRGLQKCLEVCPGAAWFDILANVFKTIRTLPSKATGVQPYLVNFMQYPEIPLTHALQR